MAPDTVFHTPARRAAPARAALAAPTDPAADPGRGYISGGGGPAAEPLRRGRRSRYCCRILAPGPTAGSACSPACIARKSAAGARKPANRKTVPPVITRTSQIIARWLRDADYVDADARSPIASCVLAPACAVRKRLCWRRRSGPRPGRPLQRQLRGHPQSVPAGAVRHRILLNFEAQAENVFARYGPDGDSGAK